MAPFPPISAFLAREKEKKKDDENEVIPNVDTFTQNVQQQYQEKTPEKFYQKKKNWIIGSIVVVIATVAIYLLIYALFPTIAQSSINNSGISIDSASISFLPSTPQQQQAMKKRDFDIQKTFFMNMQSTFTNTGILSATVAFHNPLNIYYNNTLLGNISLPDVAISNGYGSLNADTEFYIEDTDYFSAFSADMMTFDQFDWTLKGQADVTGVGRTVTIDLDKSFPIQGMGGFKDVNIQNFNLPGNDPQGGVLAEVKISMKNPSPIGVQLGHIVFQMGYQEATFGKLAAENVTITKGVNEIQLKGNIKPIENPVHLAKFSEMLTTYISGGIAPTYAMGLSASPILSGMEGSDIISANSLDGKEAPPSINWVNSGFQALKMDAALYNPNGPTSMVKSVKMNLVNMEVDPFHPTKPILSVPSVVADIQSPFGFNFTIYETSSNIILGTNEAGTFATVNTPWSPSTFNPTTNKLEFSINGAEINGFPDRKEAFDAYARDLSNNKTYPVNIQGVATTKAKTPIGDVTLGGIAFQAPPATPAVSTRLVQYGSLNVLPDTLKTNITHVDVTMINPFPAPLSILKLKSNVTYKGINIGAIDADISQSPFTIPIGGNATSPPLNMKMPLAPLPVATLLRSLAEDAHLNTTVFDGLLNLGGLHVLGQQNVAPTSDLFKGFNVVNFTLEAMKALKVDLGIQSTLRIGEKVTDLALNQLGVPIHGNESVTGLIPVIGQPLVQGLVDGAKLKLHRIKIHDIHNHKVKVKLTGSITDAGPIDCKMSFPKPITVHWHGKVLGKLHMPSINIEADKGVHFHNLHAHLDITHEHHMEKFAKHLLHAKHFKWHLVDKHASVTALGYTFKDIVLDKHIRMKAFNGLKGDVKIHSFDLPEDHHKGGIKGIVWGDIYNEAQVGVEAHRIGFRLYHQGEHVANAHLHHTNLKPRKKTDITLHGRIFEQKTQGGVDAVSHMINNYIHARDAYINMKGKYVHGPKGNVKWLTRAFRTLTIKHIKIPGASHELDLIPKIRLHDAKVDFRHSDYKPELSSDHTIAHLDKPWGCTIKPTDLTMKATLKFKGQDTAKMHIPWVSAHTNDDGRIKTSFHDVPLRSVDDESFEDFFKHLTEHSRTDFKLYGYTDAYVYTAAGTLYLTDIFFNVDTYLDGFDNFHGHCSVSDVKIVGGTPDAIQSELQVTFDNPSEITAYVKDLYLPVIMDEFGSSIGTIKLPDVKIVPGKNTVQSSMQIQSSDAEALTQFLSDFLTEATIPLTAEGTHDSTDIRSLKDAFSTLELATILTGIPNNLQRNIDVVITPEALQTSFAQTQVTFFNPFDTPVIVDQATADVYFPISEDEQLKIGHIYNISSTCYLPPSQYTICDPWEVQLLAGLPQLEMILQANDTSLNLQENVTVTIGGTDGFVGSTYYYQDHTPTVFDASALGALPPANATVAAANATVAANTTAAANTTVTTTDPSADTLPPTNYNDIPTTSTTIDTQTDPSSSVPSSNDENGEVENTNPSDIQ
ncbi:unnamed protein product [Cunninghamella blakesleeana]